MWYRSPWADEMDKQTVDAAYNAVLTQSSAELTGRRKQHMGRPFIWPCQTLTQKTNGANVARSLL